MHWKRKLKHTFKHIRHWEPSALDITILISSVLIGLLIVIMIDISQRHQTQAEQQPARITIEELQKFQKLKQSL